MCPKVVDCGVSHPIEKRRLSSIYVRLYSTLSRYFLEGVGLTKKQNREASGKSCACHYSPELDNIG